MFLFYVAANLTRVACDETVPKIDLVARVKEHRQGARGDRVEGEEHMRKIIIQWESLPGALGYEVCHNCDVAEDGSWGGKGEVIEVPVGQERSGRPVFVKPDVPRGVNIFHVRASTEEGNWGLWSEPRSFDVQEPGNAHHSAEEL